MRNALILVTVLLAVPALAGEDYGVSGRIVDEEGRPIEGAAIGVAKSCLAITDAEGRFSFVAYPGKSVQAWIHHDDYVGEVHCFKLPTSGAEVVLRRGLSIRGRVVFPDGAPLADAMVTSYRFPGTQSLRDLRADVRTRADGSFLQSGLRPGERFLLITLWSRHEATAGDHDVEMVIPFPVVRLTVRDEAGLPIHPRTVAYRLYRGEERLYATPLHGRGASGSDTLLPVPEGDRILVSPQCPGRELPVADFEVEGPPRLIRKSMTVPKLTHPASLSIHVRDPAGKPMKRAHLRLINRAGAEHLPWKRRGVELDDLGCAVIEGLPPGEYRVIVSPPSRRRANLLSVRGELTLRPGRKIGRSFVLPPGGHLRIRVSGTDATDSNVDRFTLVLRHPDGHLTSWQHPFPDPGVCSRLGHPLPPGKYTVQLLRDDEVVAERTAVVKVGQVAGVTVEKKGSDPFSNHPQR